MDAYLKQFQHLKIRLVEIRSSTNNFDDEKNYIGGGGFGKVYKGEVSHSKGRNMAAIKRLDRRNGQGTPEFLKEITMLSRYRHANLVCLLGFCYEESEMILVYEHASRGSLDRHLNSPHLTWTQRLKICLDAAKGLSYLHDPRETHQRLIHCDVKSANILLDDHWNAKVSDFGLSIMGPAKEQQSVIITLASGTYGYCDPLYEMTHTLTKESDVYSFGVVLFEVLCGKLCYRYKDGRVQQILVSRWIESYKQNKLDDIIFKGLIMQRRDPVAVKLFSDIAYRCLNDSREDRPKMAEVVQALEGALRSQEAHDRKRLIEWIQRKASIMTKVQHLIIPLQVIKSATSNFDDNNIITSGGFGKLYNGKLARFKHGKVVAIKRLDRTFRKRDLEFWTEIMILSHCKHENLIHLHGFCDEGGEKILVYELAHNGSLDRHLNSTTLTWTQRIKICIDAARGLRYLHDHNKLGTHEQIVLHRDIKSSNILLDGNWNAKVSNMGKSKLELAYHDDMFFSTDVVGTRGYLDPMYIESGILTKESDVYSFGVVLLEVLCGTLYFENTHGKFPSLVHMWKHSYENKKLNEAIFPYLIPQMDPSSLETFSDVAFQCLMKSREERPTMSVIVEKLQFALDYQDVYEMMKLEKEYEMILKDVVPPFKYTSAHHLEMLMSKGLLLNGGKTWWSLNDNREHCVMISIADCLIPDEEKDYYYSLDYSSRFQLGSCTIYPNKFKTRVRTQFLSPLTTYKVNLVFKCRFRGRKKASKHGYTPLIYKFKGETKSSIVYLAGERKDGWLMAELYRFTSDQSGVDLEISFEDNMHIEWLQVDGFELHPLEKGEHHMEYQEILEAATPSLVYTSVDELKVLLSNGVLLNRCKTWFSVNHKGEHSEMISIAECLSPPAEKYYQYLYDYNSRFMFYIYKSHATKLKSRVKTQFLSPQITYTVNLVFKIGDQDKAENAPKQYLISLSYKIIGEAKKSVSYLADKREDGCYMVELYQFTSDQRNIELEIIFYDHRCPLMRVEGIEFHPLGKEEHEILEEEDDKLAMQPISDAGDTTSWEQKLPKDYQDIIKWSKAEIRWTTKKQLYLLLCEGFLIHNGQAWFSLDKNWKKCQMLSARASLVINRRNPNWLSLPESRFGEAVMLDSWIFSIASKIRSQELSPQTTYACYLVYKLQYNFENEAPLEVRHKDLGSDDGDVDDSWYIYLVSPQTPVIRPKNSQNSRNRVHRPKTKGIPRQRSDGWMEVQISKFQSKTTTEMIHMHLELAPSNQKPLHGVFVQGVEFRPI